MDVRKANRLKYDFLGLDTVSAKRSLVNRLLYTIGKDNFTATPRDWLNATIFSVRDRLIERWMETMRNYYNLDSKRVYYFSSEFLMGRTLENALFNMDFLDECKEALAEYGAELGDLLVLEDEMALGNGGLGRLAACFLDSFATLRLPGYGYGIRYEYGMFRQVVESGEQCEQPDNWLRYGNAWEFPRAEVLFPVRFGGRVIEYYDRDGVFRHEWVETADVLAMAYDNPIPGYGTNTVNNLRLWAARATRDFDLRRFNEGDYMRAVAQKNDSENLSKVLYPSDTTSVGKELRLKQQYFFVSASLQDIVSRFKKHHADFSGLPDKVAIQLNDTHPAIAIPELMRILLDLEHLNWDEAWGLSVRVFSYTNHTLMPEALERWPVSLFEQWFPRHLQIIYEINRRFLDDVRHRYPGRQDLWRSVSLIEEGEAKQVRMAHMAVVGSHAVNGVAGLHTQLLRSHVLADFDRIFPGRIINITNGVTPRRWLHHANRGLARLLRARIGSGWMKDLTQLRELEAFAQDRDFQAEFSAVKLDNKQKLAGVIKLEAGIDVDPASLFDVQVKRIHEYKRQLLNILHVISSYAHLRRGGATDVVPRTVIFSGKAAPGYWMAKLIIRLINDVAEVVNNDPATEGRLKIVFIPNYNVTRAELIVPAADLSEQISTAGTEASGTGNMKLALNGALTIGTLDGANIEIRDAVGEENIFIFGRTAQQINEQRAGYVPSQFYEENRVLKEAVDMVGAGFFSPDQPRRYQSLLDSLFARDQYFVFADFAAYAQAQANVGALFQQPAEWTRRAVLNVARMGFFSSDRCVMEYAKKIWDVQPVSPEA